MPNNQIPEISYLIQNILPLFASQFNFPLPEDEQKTKIDQMPVRIASGVKKPDVVYYWENVPVFLIEAKKEGRSENDAVEQALSYIRNFPVKEYSKDGIRPRFFAVTIGKQIFFYAHRFEIEKNNFKDWAEKLETPIVFSELLQEYGLKKIEKKIVFTPNVFHKEVLNELGPIYKFEEKITPDVVKSLDKKTKVLDFECGSGGFLAAAIDKGVPLENIRGVDIGELPYIIAKTYLALYFKKI